MRVGGTKYDRQLREKEDKASGMLSHGILSPSDIAVSCGLTLRQVELLKFEMQSRAALAGRKFG